MLAGSQALWAEQVQPSPPESIPTIKGIVVDKDGKAVSQAKVFVLIHDQKTRKRTSEPIAVAKNGTFAYTPKRPATEVYCSFAASAPGYSYGNGYGQMGRGSDVRIVLYPEFKLKGRVVDEAGKPIGGVSLAVSNCYAYSGSGSGLSSNFSSPDGKPVSAKDGSFVIGRLPSPDAFSQYYLSISASKKGRATLRTDFQKDKVSGSVKITLPLECLLEGAVYLPGKSGPVPKGTHLMVRIPEKWGWDMREGTVDAAGKFRVAALPPGDARVLLAVQGLSWGPNGKPIPNAPEPYALPVISGVTLAPGMPRQLEVVLAAGAIVKGIVTDKSTGKPIANASLNVFHSGHPEDIYPENAATNDNGEFALRVAAGDVSVRLERFGNTYYQPNEAPSLELKVEDGKDQANLTLAASPSAGLNDLYSVQSKPIPADFELTPGTYDLTWDPQLDCSRAVHIGSDMDEPGVRKWLKGAPTFASKKAKLYAYRFDGSGDAGRLAVAVDESKGDGKGYDTAYIDLNRNRDLTDDEPVSFKTLAKWHDGYTEWVEVPSHQGPREGESMDHPVLVRLEIYFGDGYISASLQKKGGWRGQIDSGKGKVECAVLDSNCDGIYGGQTTWKDNGEPENWGDELYIDTNAFGKLAMIGYGPHEIRPEPVTKVGSKFCLMSCTPLGNKLTVAPYTGETGTLLVRGDSVHGQKASAESIYVTSTNGSYSIECADGRPAALPVGSYRIYSCGLKLAAKTGSPLHMSCRTDSKVVITPGNQTTLAINGRLSMAVNPEKPELVWQAGSSQTMSWIIKIGDDATLSSIGDRSERYQPKVKFFDNSGKVVHTTSANYT